jgi:hypothetical protein
MKRGILAIIVAVVAVPATASDTRPLVAEWYGSNLQRLCDADPKSAEYAMCWSFIGAVLEVVNNNSIYDLKACIPPLVNVQTAVDLTAKWLHDHPDNDIKAASLVATEALATAFPCKNSN